MKMQTIELTCLPRTFSDMAWPRFVSGNYQFPPPHILRRAKQTTKPTRKPKKRRK